MIDYIRGTLSSKEITHVALEAHGVGYSISIPLSTYEQLPDLGAEVKLHIHYHVREDAHKLYGFYTRAEKDAFRQLISVTGIGPKVGLSILSGISIDDLSGSINAGDPRRLEKIPGIGKKTAERLVLELKGKLGSLSLSSSNSSSSKSSGFAAKPASVTGIKEEAFAAMLSLGYNDKQVVKALSRVEETIGAAAPVEEWIRKALQVI
jgi:Holliday junction DNA helicase RuvA